MTALLLQIGFCLLFISGFFLFRQPDDSSSGGQPAAGFFDPIPFIPYKFINLSLLVLKGARTSSLPSRLT